MARYVSKADGTTCPATSKAGKPCGTSYGLFGEDGHCLWHSADPEMVEHLKRMQSNGGKNSHGRDPDDPLIPPPNPTNIEDAREYLGWVAHQAITGALGHQQAQAATRAILAWIRAENYAAEIRAIKKQVADLLKAAKVKRS